jgi:hypothetical protein
MKRTSILALLGLLVLSCASSDAAPRAQAPVTEPTSVASAEVVADGTELVIIDNTPVQNLRWNRTCGFHFGHCDGRNAGKFKVWSQRFAGYDATAGRPIYVSGTRF